MSLKIFIALINGTYWYRYYFIFDGRDIAFLRDIHRNTKPHHFVKNEE